MKRRNRATFVQVGMVGALITCGSEVCAGEHWQLTWSAPVGCPQRQAVLEKVRDIVGESLAQTAMLQADGRIVKVAEGYRLELRIVRDTGEHQRTVDAKACEDLLGASAVVLGLHLRQAAADEAAQAKGEDATTADSSETAPPAEEGPAQVGEPEKAPLPDPPGEPGEERPEPDSGRGSRYVWLALPQVALAVGSLPQSSWLWGAGLGLRHDDWAFWLSGRYQAPQTVADSTVPNVVATIDRYSGELGISNGWTGAHGQIAPGVFAGLDHVVARGGGSALDASRAVKTFAFAGAGVSLRWFATDWLALVGNVCGEVPLSRPRFIVDSLGEIGRLQPVHLRVGLGSEWNL